ncbi:retinitis pigmentosa 1-like 1 protein [Anguilla rostrata]|uniref:retinitis pigmentosa 1-like 1 protein n=1 Tax=Anguilla rostrata TaxID=7938 RepID=UPI0030CFE688
MDEVEKYQQRLQAISEKRRLQEEQEQMKREVEEERLKLQQLKRKSLRDQWLMNALPSAPDGRGADSPLQEPQAQEPEEQQRDALQTEDSQLAEAELKDLEVGHRQTHTDRDPQDAGQLRVETAGGDIEHLECWTREGAEGPWPDLHTQTAPLKNGQEGRSVLGVVELQVERDLKTGATVILSVAPVAPGQTGAPGETVFDDGCRSVQAVGGVGATPSPEELGQILDVLKGAGLQALLGETQLIPNGREEREEQEVQDTRAEENGLEVDTDAGGNITHSALQQEVMYHTSGPPEKWEGHQLGGEGLDTEAEGSGDPVTMTTEAEGSGDPVTMTTEAEGWGGPVTMTTEAEGLGDPVTMTTEAEGWGDPVTMTTEAEGWGDPVTMTTEAEGWGCPVTMTFLGFAEAEPGEEGTGEIIHAERVIITDEGDEPPSGGAENPSVPPTSTPTPEESAVIPARAERAPEASAVPDSEPPGEDTPASEGGAETEERGARTEEGGAETEEGGAESEEGGALEPTALQQQVQGREGRLPEDSTLQITADSSHVPLAVTAQAPPPANAQGEGKAEAEAQAELPRAASVGAAGGGARPQGEGTGESEAQPLPHAAGQQIPATPAELQPLVPLPKDSLSPGEGGEPPKHKSCQCCSVM